ncbi:PEPxxWA-CTERM sorting domain-containing protein [Parasphingorhabdus sp.]|uniref:PEPxxWA-CTERM sorting domain-containing protein n=1 Tax=Parasphingorhabdus sp. TaxID=2709688 RepID=UPI003BB0CFDE
MRAKHLAAGAALAASFTLATPASAVVIDFDSLSNGDVVTNQFPEAIFSSTPGSEILVTAQNLGSSPPNFICSGVMGSINCVDDIFVDFTSAVSGLSFIGVGINAGGDVGDVRVLSGMTLLGTVDIFGTNGIGTIDLTAFSNITRIEISNTDPAGIGFDDFTFDIGMGGAVPEPATWAFMILGFGAIGGAMRRQRKATVKVSYA